MSRKDLDQFSDDDNEEEEDEYNEDIDSEEQESGEEDEEEDNDVDDEDSNEAEEESPRPKAKKPEKSENGIRLINMNQEAEVEKGKAVKNQLSQFSRLYLIFLFSCDIKKFNFKDFWDLLLDTRIKMQPMINAANQFPQHGKYQEIHQSLLGNSDNDAITNESKSNLKYQSKIKKTTY